MIHRRLAVATGLLLGVGIAPAVPAQDAQDVRASLAAPPDKLYPVMFRLADRNDWEGFNRALETLRPLVTLTDRRVDGDFLGSLERAVAADEQGEAVLYLARFMTADLGVQLADAAADPDLASRRRRLRQAFSDYLALEPRLKTTEFQATRDISNAFRSLYRLAHDVAACQTIATSLLSQLANAIEGALEGERDAS